MSTTIHRTRPNILRVSLLTNLQLISHTFCYKCIIRSLQSSTNCPIDRTYLLSESISPAPKIVLSMVNELLVQCPRECGARVERGCLTGHLKDCELAIVTCLCGDFTTRRDQRAVLEHEFPEGNTVEEHRESCIHEWTHCSSCTTKYRRFEFKVLPLIYR
jgi:Zinc finger, C3HC4 type (RING finger)